MKELSAELLARLSGTVQGDGEAFTALGEILTDLRSRPVILKRAPLPPGTASGLWLDLEDMDIIAVREDTANSEHEHVIVGHEIWHMFEGHSAAHTAAGPAAARAAFGHTFAAQDVIRLLTVSGDDRLSGISERDLRSVGRTEFDDRHEAEAETFGLRFGTALRALHRVHHRPDRNRLAGRIEDSMFRGPWT
jgi:hypothetical protein